MATSNSVAVRGEKICFYHNPKTKKPTLDNIDIGVPKGAIYGLLGPSGCGKTTLLRCIVGRLYPQSGTIRVFGRIPGESRFCIPGRGVGYMPQDLALYPEISVEETLIYFGRLYQMETNKLRERKDFILSLVDLPSKKVLIKNMSGGQKRRVSFAIALIHKPPLLILDEPTVGVDPLLRQTIWKYLRKLANDDELTVIITTHYVEEARQADMVGLMREGRLLIEKNPEYLLKRYNAPTLEDVFLRLCRKDAEDHEGEDGVLVMEQTAFLNGDCPSSYEPEDVWVPAESVPVRVSPFIEMNNGKFSNGQSSPSFGSGMVAPSIYKRANMSELIVESVVRMNTLVAKNFLRLRRNIPLAFFQIMVPFLQVIVFCLCVGGEPFDLPVAIVNMEKDPTLLGQKFIDYTSNKTFIKMPFDNLSMAIESTKNGETWGVIHIGRSFSPSLMDRFLDGSYADNETISGSEVHLYLDTTNQQIAITIYTKLLTDFQKFAVHSLHEVGYNPRLADSPIVMKDPIYGQKEPDFTQFMAPGMVLGITYLMAVGMTAMSIIMEKSEGLLDRSMVAGVTPGEVIFSILFHLFVAMLLQVMFVLLCTFLVFHIPIYGSVVEVVLCVLNVGLAGMTFGLFLSSICSDDRSSLMIALGTFYPNFILSGILWPFEAMPYYLRYISVGLPMTLSSRYLQNVLYKGWNIFEHDMWHGPTITFSWAVFFVVVTWIIFRSKKYS